MDSAAETIARVMQEMAPQLETLLRAELNRRKLVDTGNLLSSINTTIKQGQLPSLLLSFDESGFFQDRNKWLPHDNQPALIDWVQRNLSKINYTPGYQNAQQQPTAEKQAERIAFAIQNKQRQKGYKPKNRPWIYKKFWQWYNDFGEQLLEQLSEEQINQLIALQNGNN